MNFTIIDEKKFKNNLEFFANNIGYVYNLDDYDTLKANVKGRYNLTRDNYQSIKQNRYNSVFKECQDNFNELHDRYFLSIAYEDRIYAIACFCINDDYCFIDGVETQINHRNQGLAKQVIKNGLKEISVEAKLQTSIGNFPAQNLYQKLGFKQTEQDDKFVYFSLPYAKQNVNSKQK